VKITPLLINLSLWYPESALPTSGLSYRTALLFDPDKTNATPRRCETLFQAGSHTITFDPSPVPQSHCWIGIAK
jgi:hypothetical protein